MNGGRAVVILGVIPGIDNKESSPCCLAKRFFVWVKRGSCSYEMGWASLAIYTWFTTPAPSTQCWPVAGPPTISARVEDLWRKDSRNHDGQCSLSEVCYEMVWWCSHPSRVFLAGIERTKAEQSSHIQRGQIIRNWPTDIFRMRIAIPCGVAVLCLWRCRGHFQV